MIEIFAKKKTDAGPRIRAALDIGSSTVKILEASESGGRFSLAKYAMKDIAGRTKEEIPHVIRTLAADSRITAKEFAISVSGHAVQARFIAMPRMKEEELAGAAAFEAEKFMPFNINECVVDFHVLKAHERENKLDLVLVAAKKDYVEERIRLAEEAGFKVNVVDVDSLAIANAFLRNLSQVNNEKTAALVNIGASSANLCILKGAELCFVRTIDIGGDDFDAAISRAMGVDTASARELKMKPGEKAAEVADCARGTFNTLADETRLSFGYYENQYGRAVDEIYLSGGSSSFPGIEEIFREAFGSKPIVWNPLKFMDISGVSAGLLDNVKRYFAVAAGLVLRQDEPS
jgi:type IV pilus assembly protein PilM